MQVSLETGAGLERRLRVQVPAGRVDEEVATRLKSAGQSVRLKGFRPGKVPANVVRQRFGPQIRQEVLQDVIQSSCSEAITQEKLRLAGSPRIEMDALQDGQDLRYTAVFEIYPDFKVTGLDSLTIEKPEVAISDADLDQTIERLRVQRATWSPVQRAAAAGDRITIDFDGQRDGAPLPGGKGENVNVVLGEGRMIPDFENNLTGLAPGQSKTFTANFPADYHEESLRSARVQFAVQAREVAERVLPALDADFVRGFDVESGDVTEFRRMVRENLEREIAAKVQSEQRRQAMEALLTANPIELPEVLVQHEAANLQAEAMRNLGIKDAKDAPSLKTYEDVARRRVRLGLIMAAVIQDQGLKVDPSRMEQKLTELCQPYDNPDQVRGLYRENAQLMAQIENAVMEEQLMLWLIERSRVTTKPVTFATLMGM